jgi:uncharacterized protein (DUF2236 family)
MIQKLASSFRQTVSGSPEGRPSWVKSIEECEGPGLFGPESAVWEVHGSVSTLIGGIRALLLQAAHPAALAGVREHSRYETDLLGRLQGTSRWLTITTFGSHDLITKEAERVNAMHRQVKGQYIDRLGNHDDYAAGQPRFLLWVHCAFTESFLKAHMICRYPIRNSYDDYVREWSASARPLGLLEAPESTRELEEEITRFLQEELSYTQETEEVIDFILHPPFGFFAKFFYRPLAKTAIRSLSDAERSLLHLRKPVKIWELIARLNLRALQKALGDHSPAQRAALKRYKRLANSSADNS